jgi:hypothetical protein
MLLLAPSPGSLDRRRQGVRRDESRSATLVESVLMAPHRGSTDRVTVHDSKYGEPTLQQWADKRGLSNADVARILRLDVEQFLRLRDDVPPEEFRQRFARLGARS